VIVDEATPHALRADVPLSISVDRTAATGRNASSDVGQRLTPGARNRHYARVEDQPAAPSPVKATAFAGRVSEELGDRVVVEVVPYSEHSANVWVDFGNDGLGFEITDGHEPIRVLDPRDYDLVNERMALDYLVARVDGLSVAEALARVHA
jgi:hypothetical protein